MACVLVGIVPKRLVPHGALGFKVDSRPAFHKLKTTDLKIQLLEYLEYVQYILVIHRKAYRVFP